MPNYTGVYTFTRSFAAPAAITLLQLKMDANHMCEVIRASVTQYQATAASAQVAAKLVRKSVAATVTASAVADFGLTNPSSLVPTTSIPFVMSTSGTGYNASAEGTDTDGLAQDGFNHLNGWFYLPAQDERDLVLPGGIIAVKLIQAAPASTTYYATLRVGLYG